jgi:hypothetical protein
MAEYTVVTTTRTTPPDLVGLLASLRSAIAPEVGMVFLDPQTVNLKKTTAWSAAEKATAQGLIDTAPALTPQLAAQNAIDNMDRFDKAKILVELDQFNLIRSKLVPPLPPITEAQMVAAIRTKAGTI